jgi:regulator of sigma E protease
MWQSKETLYTLNWLLFGSFIKMAGEKNSSIPGSFAGKSKKTRFAVLITGPLLSLITIGIFLTPAILFFTLANMAGVPEPITGINFSGQEAPIAKTVIIEIVEESPAAVAGLQVGDTIIGADEIEFRHMGDMIAYIEKTKGTEITLHIERNDQTIKTPIVPRTNPPENQGALGVSLNYEDVETKITPYPFHRAFTRGVMQTVQYVGLTFYLPIAIYRDTIPAEAARPTSGTELNQFMMSAANEAAFQNQWFSTFWLMGILGVSAVVPVVLLTLISFLPFPGWDSWRILALIFGR